MIFWRFSFKSDGKAATEPARAAAESKDCIDMTMSKMEKGGKDRF